MTNFGSSKTDLNLRYRLGLEHALAKADFLNAPDITLVQAFAIFLSLVRRHDSPRFVWMMTGLLIRMAQYLGLQRDGPHFEHLTPFEIEMRRRVWAVVLMLDMRASEDQGTELTVTSGFDTKIPLNINDADICPETEVTPAEHHGVTDMSIARINAEICEVMRQMMAPGVGREDQSRLLDEIYQKYEHGYFQHVPQSGNLVFWVGLAVVRLTMAKMTLVVSLPVLFSSPNEDFSEELRTKLLIAAIEVAEYNHTLNDEKACRHWRWIYQTYTHWHSIIFMMIELSRRPWSSVVERAWVALHSSWLFPDQGQMNKNLRIWVPLRKLMAKASRHREAELTRLRADPQAVANLDMQDQKIPRPSSSGPFLGGSSVDIFRERWYQLVSKPEGPRYDTQIYGISDAQFQRSTPKSRANDTIIGTATAEEEVSSVTSNMTVAPLFVGPTAEHGELLEITNNRSTEANFKSSIPDASTLQQSIEQPYSHAAMDLPQWPDGSIMGRGTIPWLWADTDPSVNVFSGLDDPVDINMDWDGQNWNQWLEVAGGLQLDTRPGGTWTSSTA